MSDSEHLLSTLRNFCDAYPKSVARQVAESSEVTRLRTLVGGSEMSDQNDPKVIERYLQERRARLTAMLRDDTFANVAIEMEAADRIEELEVAIEAYRVAIEAYRRDPTLLMPTGPGVDVRYAEEAEGGVHGNAVRPNPVPPTVKERYE